MTEKQLQEHFPELSVMDFLHWKGCGGNNENDMFRDLFINLLPQEPEFTTADILMLITILANVY